MWPSTCLYLLSQLLITCLYYLLVSLYLHLYWIILFYENKIHLHMQCIYTNTSINMHTTGYGQKFVDIPGVMVYLWLGGNVDKIFYHRACYLSWHILQFMENQSSNIILRQCSVFHILLSMWHKHIHTSKLYILINTPFHKTYRPYVTPERPSSPG